MYNKNLHKELLDLRDIFKKLSNEYRNWERSINTEREYHKGKADAYRLSYKAMKDILETYF